MKKYLEDLRKELQKRHMSETEIADIIADHEEMINNAIEAGLNEDELKDKFGDPHRLADELAGNETNSEADEEDYILWKTFAVSGDSYSVEIKSTDEDISFRPSRDGQIRVFYTGKSPSDKVSCTFENNKLVFTTPKMRELFFFMRSHGDSASYVIELPAKLVVDEFTLTNINGDCRLEGLTINHFVINTTNGDINCHNLSIGDVKWNTVNGDMSLSSSKAGSIFTSQISGDMTLKKLEVDEGIKMTSVSGDIRVEDSTCGELDLNTVSGDLIGKEFYPHKIVLRTISGDVRISNSEKTEIAIDKQRSLSGDIRITP